MSVAMKSEQMTEAERREYDRQEAIWRRILVEVREQVTADVIAIENRPLVFGEHVAWAICRYKGVTDDLSTLHRVGHPLKGEPATTCGEKIPVGKPLLPLGPAFLENIRKCRYCEAELQRIIARDHAA